MNIVNGELVTTSDEIGHIRDFIGRWQPKIKEIKKTTFDFDQSYWIAEGFLDEAMDLLRATKSEADGIRLFTQLANDLHLALHISYSNFRRENKTFRSYFFRE